MIKLIYVADDMGSIRLSLQAKLKAGGYAVHSFASGNGLIRAAAGVAPDLVITDMVMPDGDGYAVIKALADSVPVIALSGAQPVGGYRMTDHVLDMATIHGATATIAKSADLAPLLAAVADVLG